VRRRRIRSSAYARVRIRELPREVKAQIPALKVRQQEAARVVKNLSAAAEGSREDVKQSADAILADACRTATAVVERLREAVSRHRRGCRPPATPGRYEVPHPWGWE